MNILLPVFHCFGLRIWSTSSQALGPELATCAGLAHWRDNSNCRASEQKWQKRLGHCFSLNCRKYLKTMAHWKGFSALTSITLQADLHKSNCLQTNPIIALHSTAKHLWKSDHKRTKNFFCARGKETKISFWLFPILSYPFFCRWLVSYTADDGLQRQMAQKSIEFKRQRSPIRCRSLHSFLTLFFIFNRQLFLVVMMWSTVRHSRDCSQLSFCWQPSWVSVFFYWNLSTYSKATVLLFKASQASLSRPGAAATNSETPCICSCLSFLPLLAKALPKELGHGFCSQTFDCFLEQPLGVIATLVRLPEGAQT